MTRLYFCKCGHCDRFGVNDVDIDYLLVLLSVIYKVRFAILSYGQLIYCIQYMYIVY